MPKQTRQPSGVVPGTLDVSRSTTPEVTAPTPAAEALSRRRTAAGRAHAAEARVKEATAGATVRELPRPPRTRASASPRADAALAEVRTLPRRAVTTRSASPARAARPTVAKAAFAPGPETRAATKRPRSAARKVRATTTGLKRTARKLARALKPKGR